MQKPMTERYCVCPHCFKCALVSQFNGNDAYCAYCKKDVVTALTIGLTEHRDATDDEKAWVRVRLKRERDKLAARKLVEREEMRRERKTYISRVVADAFNE